jgi:hypothetical protein
MGIVPTRDPLTPSREQNDKCRTVVVEVTILNKNGSDAVFIGAHRRNAVEARSHRPGASKKFNNRGMLDSGMCLSGPNVMIGLHP